MLGAVGDERAEFLLRQVAPGPPCLAQLLDAGERVGVEVPVEHGLVQDADDALLVGVQRPWADGRLLPVGRVPGRRAPGPVVQPAGRRDLIQPHGPLAVTLPEVLGPSPKCRAVDTHGPLGQDRLEAALDHVLGVADQRGDVAWGALDAGLDGALLRLREGRRDLVGLGEDALLHLVEEVLGLLLRVEGPGQPAPLSPAEPLGRPGPAARPPLARVDAAEAALALAAPAVRRGLLRSRFCFHVVLSGARAPQQAEHVWSRCTLLRP